MPLLLSDLTLEPHSPAAGRAEMGLSVMSQSLGTRECWGQRSLGLWSVQEGRRVSADPLSSGPSLRPQCHAVLWGKYVRLSVVLTVRKWGHRIKGVTLKNIWAIWGVLPSSRLRRE